ncbi:MAG: VWA domain-containing protein [Verrucomicrobia bacterium]|nr:VWA domain-containing protein [Verrucomicrobiota bacterium]
MSRWSFAASIPVVVLALAVWLTAAWLCHANWKRSGRRKVTAWLELLRLVLITLLGFSLLRPEFVRQIQRTEFPEIIVLSDVSGSMNTRDIVVSGDAATNVITRYQWLAEKRQAKFWAPLEKTAKVTVEDFAAPPAGTNATTVKSEIGTDLSLALDTVLKREKNLKAVLLLTDGDWNLGKSPVGIATRYREQQIPIFSVAVGREAPLPDVVLESVSAPSYGLFGEQISIPFKVRNHLPREVKTVISLFDSKLEETKKEIVIPALGELQEAIVWSPRAVGERSLALRLPIEADEGLLENNEQTFRIAVRLETLKVLVIDSLPRWEYRFLRNALERDPGVEMNCLLLHPGMTPGSGRQYLPSFPGSKEMISRYDVIFLGDVGVGEGELTEKEAELIKGLVEQQSSGLVFLPGNRGRQLTFLNSPLQELIPVQLDRSKPEGIGLQNESALQLSTVGKRHLLTRFDADEYRNDEIWRQLPGFYWSAAVEKSRPGSEVLAVHASQRNSWGRMPLLVTRPFGSGKVLFMGTDSAWRWRRGVEDKYHYRFWSQVVRWMAHQRHLSEKQGIRLSYTPETPQAGDTVFLQTTVLDAAGFPIEEGTVAGRVSAPTGRGERLEFTPLSGGWGVFKASFSPQEGGKYTVRVSSEKHGRNLETEILVTQPVREKQGQPVNAEILREMAGITEGASGAVDSLDQIVQRISLLPEAKPIEKRIRLWSEPWWGGAILFLLAVYWAGRKLAGMV